MAFSRYQYKKRKLALIIPAHNEEMVIESTIRSAIAASLHPADIFVVADGCHDGTVEIATRLLGESNVLDQLQTGKARAIEHAIRAFNIPGRYDWLHIADADGAFDSKYFEIVLARLDRRYVAMTGHIQSLKGSWIGKYRVYEYALGLEIMRRIQAFLGVIPVMPGPTSIFRTDILARLDFKTDSLAEDMDLTLQIHRAKLGRILYIPEAKTFSQDPKDLADYTKQISRWYRGNFQAMQRHRIGLHPQKIDAYLAYIVLEQWILVMGLITLPVMAWWYQNYEPLALLFLDDLVIFFVFITWAAAKNERADIISAFPLFYLLRFLSLAIFVRSWFEIVVQHKFRSASAGWSTAGRRYRIGTSMQ